jgi:hypothetical protein
LKLTVHAVVGLVIVTVPLLIVHPPETVYATASPELAVAATRNVLLYAALEGAAVVTVIVWLAFAALTVAAAEVVAL